MKNILIKTIAIFLFCIVSFSNLAISKVSAHTLETDGAIGAVLHVNPDDDPIVGKEAEFFFELKDTSNNFSADHCDCRLLISEADQEVSNQFLKETHHHTSGLSTTYVFPKKGLYILKLVGKPIQGAQFQAFTLTYPLRVERVDDQLSSSADLNLYILIIILIAIAGGITGLWLVIKKRNGISSVAILLLFFLIIPFHLSHYFHSNNSEHHTTTKAHECCLPITAPLLFAPISIDEVKDHKMYHDSDKESYQPELFSSSLMRAPPSF